jgi:hypothetical protein
MFRKKHLLTIGFILALGAIAVFSFKQPGPAQAQLESSQAYFINKL